MPIYIYTAKSLPSKTIQGEIEAETEQEAINKLIQMGYFPISVKSEEHSLEKKGIRQFFKISRREIVLFTRQLSTLIESGVNILNGLNIISNQTANKYLKIVLGDIIHKIQDGNSFSESLSSHPSLFSNLYSSMIRTGETGGNLSETLKRLADFLEKEEEFKNSIRAALTYPFFIFSVGVLTIIILLGFVIPRLITMFEDMGQILPLPTRILINTSNFLRNFWWFIFAIIVILVFFLRRLYQKPQGRLMLDRFKLRVIILGQIILKTEIGRLMRTLSLLISGGITIVYSLDISSSIVDNQILKLEIGKFKDQVANGLSFSGCIKESKLFPAFVSNIVTVGEETGNLEKSLLTIANDYEREVDRTLKTLVRLLEPIIILLMGLIVGFIVLSMLLPIFQINLIVK